MKIEKTRNSIFIEFSNGFIINIWECLTEIIFNKQYNWNTWQFINIEFENDRAMQGLEFTFVLLCCGIRIRIPAHPKKEHYIHKEVLNSIKKIKESCYGWVENQAYKAFKNKEIRSLIVYKTRRPGYRKKIFIQ